MPGNQNFTKLLCDFLVAADQIAHTQPQLPPTYVSARKGMADVIAAMVPSHICPPPPASNGREKRRVTSTPELGLLHQLLAGTVNVEDTKVRYDITGKIMRAERGNEACLIVEPGKGVPLQDEPIGDCNFAAAVVRKLRGYAGKHLPAHRLSRELQEDAKNDVDLKTLLQEFHRPSPSPVSVDALDDRPPRLIRSSSYAMLSKSSIHVAFGFALEFSVDSPDPPQSFQLVVFLAHPETPYFRTVQDPLWAPQRSGKDVLNLLFCNAPGPGSIEGPSSAPAAAPLPPGNVPPLTGTMMPPIQDSEQVVEDFFNMLTNLENTVWAPPSSDSNMSYLGTDH